MPAKVAPNVDALYTQLQRRLIENGEWDRYVQLASYSLRFGVASSLIDRRILSLLANRLNESGWTDDLRHRSKGISLNALFNSISNNRTERARTMEPLLFQVLFTEVMPEAQSEPSCLHVVFDREPMGLPMKLRCRQWPNVKSWQSFGRTWRSNSSERYA
jgi:enhancer of yellow 2 transcription factor